MLSYIFDSEIGQLYLQENDSKLTRLAFLDLITREYNFKRFDERGLLQQALNGLKPPSPLLVEAGEQLRAYFAGRLKKFSLPLNPAGTDFQKKVWAALEHIPYGKTASYKDIAQHVDSPKGFRAVGMANNKNPIAVIIPCHRVIGANGSLMGYGGGVDIKQALLRLEGVLP